MPQRPTRQRGFTLVELLVIVAVIALLIGILLPTLADARRQARTVFCLANMSQLGVAMQIYADRNREFLPQVWGGSVKWGEERGALYQLLVTSGVMLETTEFPKVLICPDARPTGSISYALNAVLFGYRHPTDTGETDPLAGLFVPSVQVGSVNDPSKVVGLYDVRVASLARVWHQPTSHDEADVSDQFTGNGMLGIAQPNPAGFMWQQSIDNPPLEAEPPHGKGHNILFADTHAATHPAWEPETMTRLTGREPNDTTLY
jgi:prepilin-type N-terminal cleavage/methylation domain-containing protein/prepilin-type processing-associated H-X9-DG protein